jgi:hypothetical protein
MKNLAADEHGWGKPTEHTERHRIFYNIGISFPCVLCVLWALINY